MRTYQESDYSILGVSGRMLPRHTWTDALWFTQKWISEQRAINGYGADARISAEIRFDDECKNGHNTFTITASVITPASLLRRDVEACGCLHDDIARVFPELAPLIRWHLVSTDGPMHYLANTLYQADDRDQNGLRAGESMQIRNGKTGELCWKLEKSPIDAPQYVDSPTEPAAPNIRYVPWVRIGKGKARDLDAARRSACWPEATDEELCAPREVLELALRARLPALLAAFRADMDAAGFAWSPEAVEA